jgi:FO synthase
MTLDAARLSDAAARELAHCDDLSALMRQAAALRDRGHGDVISYSRKVFIPLTHLCRDVCHYCTFAKPPRRGQAAYLDPDAVLAIARAGRDAGCTEALFTLGDRPEARYRAARDALSALGHDSTLGYLAEIAGRVLRETGLLPHLNPGVMSAEALARLRPVAASMGLMLESSAVRLCERGGPHFGSPDKHPQVRMATLEAAGALRIPMTTGLLIGIGETRAERIEALLAIRDLHARWGHVQEVIVQNFRAKPGTAMARQPDAGEDDHLWTVAVARLVLGASMSVQAPPNLAPGALHRLIAAGINDWGGVSPVTPDHVNPERPWPQLARLASETAAAGKHLVARLPVYPRYVHARREWVDAALHGPLLLHSDAAGLARDDAWRSGSVEHAPPVSTPSPAAFRSLHIDGLLARALSGYRLEETQIEALFGRRGAAFDDLCTAADELRAASVGDAVSFVVNRNINYTNICTYKCSFCAFSKGRSAAGLRGPGYDLSLAQIVERAREAWTRGATEVCLQGGIHPSYTGQTYLRIVTAIKEALPALHVHAFSPLEVWHGATSLGLPLPDYLAQLRDAGLGSLPGTAAEILDDGIRAQICPDKLRSAQWIAVMDAAHRAGLKSTATMMFGHVEQPIHWARHLLAIRDQQARSGGFTEFVPLPFVAREAPMFLRGQARPGPTWREAVAVHAVARLVLHPLIPNIQASWVKLGPQGVLACLQAGANDFGGTLMDESITRAAGASFGQEMSASQMASHLRSIGRVPRQRSTLYADPGANRVNRPPIDVLHDDAP